MSKTDLLDIDGHILLMFLAILENSSVSIAAEKMNVSQSAASQSLAKLRIILGDPLFVRSGQGLSPTKTAIALKTPVQSALEGFSDQEVWAELQARGGTGGEAGPVKSVKHVEFETLIASKDDGNDTLIQWNSELLNQR